MKRKKGILYGEYDLQDIIDRRRSLDVAGHYSRPDIFNLTVRKSKQPLINIT
jgi:nitrilase